MAKYRKRPMAEESIVHIVRAKPRAQWKGSATLKFMGPLPHKILKEA